MNKKIIKTLYIVLIILTIFPLAFIIKYYYDIYNSKKQSKLLNEISIDTTDEVITEESINSDNLIKEKNERMLKLEELQKENSDIIGWLEIENTNINYPVLQGSDNDYYLNHNYKKEKSISGSIFLDKDYCWEPPNTNLLIYGHNMSNSTMFQNLLKYKDKQFYEDHPIIRFTTTSEDSNYEIISVFRSKVYNDTSSFKYYNFINAENEEEYDNYIENIKKLSLYEIDTTAHYGDQLITLSTCAYHVKNGRFAIVGKKIY